MISPKPEEIKVRQLCKDFIRLQKGKTLDAFQASIEMINVWGIGIDWHEFSFALDELSRTNEVTQTGHTAGGACVYLVN